MMADVAKERSHAEVSTSADDVVQLSFDDHRLVVMTQETMDKLVMSVGKTIAACINQAASDAMLRTMREKFYGWKSEITDFCARHAAVKAALVEPREQGRYLLLLIVNNELPDAGMGDDVAVFQMELRRKYPEFPASVMSVPDSRPSAIATFIDPESAHLIYAVDPRTSGNR